MADSTSLLNNEESRRPSLLTALIDDSEETQLDQQRDGDDSLDRLLHDMRNNVQLSANQLRQNHQTTLKLLSDIMTESNQRQNGRRLSSMSTTGKSTHLITQLQDSQRQLAAEIERIRDKHRSDVQRICSVLVALNASMGDNKADTVSLAGVDNDYLENFTADMAIQHLSLLLDRFETMREENELLRSELLVGSNRKNGEEGDEEAGTVDDEMISELRAANAEQKNDFQRQLNDLEVSISGRDERIAELTSAESELKCQLFAMQLELSQSKLEMEQLQSSEGELKEQLAVLSAADNRNQSEITTLHQSLTELGAQLTAVREELAGKQQQIDGLLAAERQIKLQLSDANARVVELEDAGTAMIAQLTVLESEQSKTRTVQDLQDEIDSQSQRIKELESLRQHDADELEEVRLRFAGSLDALEAVSERVIANALSSDDKEMWIVDLKAQLGSAQSQIEELHNSLLSKEAELEGKQLQLTELESQLSANRAEIADLRTKLNDSQLHISKLETASTAHHEESAALNQQIIDFNSHLALLSDQSAALNALQAELSLRHSDIASLQRMIDERETDMAQLKQQHSKQLAEFQMELTAVQKQSDSQVNFEEQLNEMERLHNERMQEIVADKNGRIERLSTMLRKLESDLVQVDQLRSALADRDEKLTQTKQRIDKQQVLVEELRLQLDEKTERLDRYETERAELRSAKADLEELLASISDQSKNLHKELVAKTETLDRLTGEQSQQCERMSEISRQLGEKDDRINRMRQELQEHSQIMIQLQDQAAQAERNHQLARQEILEMESQLFEFQTQIKANSIELESMREELDENSSRLNRAHADLHERTDEVQRLHTALADMKSDNDREINVLRISIVEKSRELDELRMELLSKDTDISLLQSQLNEPASARGRRRSQRPSSQLRASYSAEDLDKIFSGPSIFDQQSNTGRCLNEAMERFDAELDETIQSIRTNLVSSSKRQSSIDVSQLVDSIQRDLSPLGLRLERDK